jgi:biotin operon repressor
MTSKLGGPFLPFPRWALKSLVGDSTAKAVLLQLLVFMDPDSQVTTTSYEYVAEQVGVDRRTVMRAVKRLESIGVLVKKNRRGVGRENNLSNLYRIRFDNPEVFEVVSPVSLGGDTGVTRGGDTHDTRVVSPVSPKQEGYNKKDKNKKNRTKRENQDFGDVEVDERLK